MSPEAIVAIAVGVLGGLGTAVGYVAKSVKAMTRVETMVEASGEELTLIRKEAVETRREVKDLHRESTASDTRLWKAVSDQGERLARMEGRMNGHARG